MILKVKRLLKKHSVTTLKELAKDLKVSVNKIKNISSGRTSFSSLGRSRTQHRAFPHHSEDLAELIGVVLGDGNISRFDRCQRLVISCNSSYERYAGHVCRLVSGVFRKKPSLLRRSKANCLDAYLYMQDIDKALGLPVGNKIKNAVRIPEWIFKRRSYIERCLKGLFETDGHYGRSREHYVEYIQFCNESKSLRRSVFRALESLGYSPQLGKSYTRLAKRAQVHRFIKEMGFQRPFPSFAT